MYTHSFEDLAHTFRILVESFLRFDQLIHIDRAEAIGNLEISTNSMLNAFHNLYDLMNTGGKKSIDWYLTPELCIILAIRNARHHNKANRIRSIHNFFVSNAATLDKKDETLYVNFSAHPKEEGALFFNVPLSWGDLDAFLTLPRKESRLRPVAKDLIREYIAANEFEQVALEKRIPKSHIFFNFVPLARNAGTMLYPFIKDHVRERPF